MTNAQIIMNEQIELLKTGKIGTTGREITFKDMEGNEISMMEPEPIHTFAHWKSLGFSVKKGEKAVASFPIWKASKKKKEDEETVEANTERTRMFMKKSHFFSLSQVEAIARA